MPNPDTDNVTDALDPVLEAFHRSACLGAAGLFRPLAPAILQRAAGMTKGEVRFRLADEAVRVWAPRLLEAKGRNADATTLSALAPIVDSATASAALEAIDATGQGGGVLFHPRDAAKSAASDDATLWPYVGQRAALTLQALAECAPDESAKRAVFDYGVALLSDLRSGRPPGAMLAIDD